ncbi:hypothetical protein HK103_000693 [Boothiomyces macroporosus]|uniref:Methyltransferase domain-containing protein n=1 Tax=Boothiomyces macroporosus TaxID=261099 RepID=A0AAD5Y5H6_9FUNG|nr:hypothetical protein HK103_000693 [Boothiomyces macroporosus]
MHLKLPEGCQDVKQLVQELIRFKQEYDWLLSNHAVDFFYCDFWNSKVPPDWHVLEECNTQELINLASFGETKAGWPFTLQEFVRKCKSLVLPRDPSISDLQDLINNSPELDKLITYGSEKKKIEVQALAAIIHHFTINSEATHIIDMGAGQGYLDACLAYQYNHTVVGVDDSTIQTCGAQFNLNRIEKVLKKRADITGKVMHVNSRVEPGELLADILGKIQGEENLRDIIQDDQSWILCGLHTCGDLASTMLRQFTKGDASALINVGCCYNHLSEECSKPPLLHQTETPKDYGFPMSKFIESQGFTLGYSTRMTACQATCRWAYEYETSVENFKKHSWRAMLQVVLTKSKCFKDIDPSTITIGRLGRGAFKHGFKEYCIKAIQKLGLPYPTEDLDENTINEVEELYSCKMFQVSVVWTLRAMMAEAIESLILLDRVLFLEESQSCKDIWLAPIFKQLDSPRNMVIVATRK